MSDDKQAKIVIAGTLTRMRNAQLYCERTSFVTATFKGHISEQERFQRPRPWVTPHIARISILM